MSNELSKYAGQRSTAITTAKRLIDLFGEAYSNVIKGLAVKFFIINEPFADPVSERAVPVQILQYPEEIRKGKLIRWGKLVPTKRAKVDDIRKMIDWEYYKKRLHNTLLKLVCIPAIYQGQQNPISEISIPDWVYKQSMFTSGFHARQQNLNQFIIDKSNTRTTNIESITKKDIDINEINNMKLKELNDKLKVQLKETQSEYSTYKKQNFEFDGFLKKTLRYWGLLRDRNSLQKRMSLSSPSNISNNLNTKLNSTNYNTNTTKEISSGKPFEIVQLRSINENNFKAQTSILLPNQSSIQKYIFPFKYTFYLFSNYKLQEELIKLKYTEIDKIKELKNKNDSTEFSFVYEIEANKSFFNSSKTIDSIKLYLNTQGVYSAKLVTPSLLSSFTLKHCSTLKQTRTKFENIKVNCTNETKNVFLYHYKTYSLELYCFNYIGEQCNDIKTVSYFIDKVNKREYKPNFAIGMKKEHPGFIPEDKYSIEDAHNYTNKMYGLFLKTVKK